MEVESKTLMMNHHPLTAVFSFLPSKSSTSSFIIIHLLRRFLLLSLRLLLYLLPYSNSPVAHTASSSAAAVPAGSSSAATPASRALSHVLSVVSRVPVASRKYDLVRSLADRLLDDNLRFSSSLNRDALSAAFSQTLRRLELAVQSPPPEGTVGAVIRKWVGEVVTGGGEVADETEKVEAEKMAAEVVWMAEKMAECGAAEEAVRRWGEAAGLGAVALTAEPRIQVAFVRVSAFLFRHANAKQFTRKGDNEEDEECDASRYRMAMLTSWLPLLCRASNGTDAPVLSSGERAEMVKILEEMIEKLSWHQQEVVLALWLNHFTSCPDSDWPNLESCYTRWYSKTRDLFLK